MVSIAANNKSYERSQEFFLGGGGTQEKNNISGEGTIVNIGFILVK